MMSTAKAVETRKRNREARAMKAQETKLIREKVKKSCLDLLENPRANPTERLEAMKILYDLTKGR